VKVVIASQDGNLDSEVSSHFGRAAYFIFADTTTEDHAIEPNPAVNQSGGAGIRAAEFVVNRGASAVVAGDVGPNAYKVFSAAGVTCYAVSGITARSCLEDLRHGRLKALRSASAAAHAGMAPKPQEAGDPNPAVSARSKQEEIGILRERLNELRGSLTETMARIEALEREE
jgi:predicted Fe-Mo cluster-binding NifX family protein